MPARRVGPPNVKYDPVNELEDDLGAKADRKDHASSMSPEGGLRGVDDFGDREEGGLFAGLEREHTAGSVAVGSSGDPSGAGAASSSSSSAGAGDRDRDREEQVALPVPLPGHGPERSEAAPPQAAGSASSHSAGADAAKESDAAGDEVASASGVGAGAAKAAAAQFRTKKEQGGDAYAAGAATTGGGPRVAAPAAAAAAAAEVTQAAQAAQSVSAVAKGFARDGGLGELLMDGREGSELHSTAALLLGFPLAAQLGLVALAALALLLALAARNEQLRFWLDRSAGSLVRRLSARAPGLVNRIALLRRLASEGGLRGMLSRAAEPATPPPKARYGGGGGGGAEPAHGGGEDSELGGGSDGGLELSHSHRSPPCSTPTPVMRGHPATFHSVVSDTSLRRLAQALPARLALRDWKLLYAAELHGYSLATAYARAAGAGPFVLVVMDRRRCVFGAFCSESLRAGGAGGMSYYGTGESFLFQMEPAFRVHRWSGRNEQIVLSSKEVLAFGGGGKFALWLDAVFEHGSSEEGSTTFEDYRCLASQEMFKCCAVEMWGFTEPSALQLRKTAQDKKAAH